MRFIRKPAIASLFAAMTLISCVSQKQPLAPEPVRLRDDSMGIPAEGGLVWFPLSWSFKLASFSKTAPGLSRLELKNVGMVLKTGVQERFFKLKHLQGQGDNSLVLEGDKITTLVSEPVVALAAGEYTVFGLRATYVSPQDKKLQTIDLPLANPFQAPSRTPLQFTVQENKIAALARIAVQSNFGLKNNALQVLTDIEPIDREVVPVDVVLKAVHRSNSDSRLVYPALKDLPRSRQQLLDKVDSATGENAFARVGLLLEVPCQTNGILKLVWKRTNEEREYYSLFPLSPKEGEVCEGSRTLAPVFSLPKADWLLKSSYIFTVDEPIFNFKLSALRDENQPLFDYFLLDASQIPMTNINLEREIERQFMARLSQLTISHGTSQVFYMGKFQLVPKVSSDKTQHWETLFRRAYILSNLKERFGSSYFYNAYTLEKLTRDRVQGNRIQSVLRVATSEEDTKIMEPFNAEFRKETTENFAECIREREELDPLVHISGQILFTALKGANSTNLKELSISSKGDSEQFIENCMRKHVVSFRFSKPLPGSMQGDLKFSSE